jgi:hypothetical protein
MVIDRSLDGTYLFSVPGSVYWIARRYNIPILTIVLNNKGKIITSILHTCETLTNIQAGMPPVNLSY